MTKIITMMTALVPTIGHKALIDFCIALAHTHRGHAHIIVGTQPNEPIPGSTRVGALRIAQSGDALRRSIHHLDRTMPQSPEEMPEGFWELWRDTVIEVVGSVGSDDIFVASELYGIDMASILGCKFMPFNRYRDMLEIKGTDVRNDLLGRFSDVLPEFQPMLRQTVTLFGPESCGKTTMAKRLAKEMNGVFVPEWAREYLETLPTPETTDDRMLDIVHGQFSMQVSAKNIINKPWIFQDTDLLSTIGYYHIFGGAWRRPKDIALCQDLFNRSKSDLYIVMNDRIPFEQDPLRYGGDKRESDKQFWIDLLQKNGCLFYEVEEIELEKQVVEIKRVLDVFYRETTRTIRKFQR